MEQTKKQKVIDIKTFTSYSRFLNLKQVCDYSGVNYNSVKDKVRVYKLGIKRRLNEAETIKLSKGLAKLGMKARLLN